MVTIISLISVINIHIKTFFMYYVNALITAKTFVLYCKRLSVSLFSVCKDKKLYNTKQTFIEKSFKN